MRRLFWTAVGAAGGIYAYRRGTRAVQQARARGLVGNLQTAAGTAAAVATQTRALLALADQAAAGRRAPDRPRLTPAAVVGPADQRPVTVTTLPPSRPDPAAPGSRP